MLSFLQTFTYSFTIPSFQTHCTSARVEAASPLCLKLCQEASTTSRLRGMEATLRECTTFLIDLLQVNIGTLRTPLEMFFLSFMVWSYHFTECILIEEFLLALSHRRIGIEANEELRSIFKRNVHLILQVRLK
ncbi:hypothetical protein RHSIM_Rhsim03G0047900 [Rhododendron simsii]|uniref:Uncharacterized protein n=1 Tax=Rhododendron simsii TaxID=118357 RepID=A0A834LQ19_RHOSS|nr:hypothetical protein RHSIM_Rhsim03G0047900 [Rhododendron simsii]